MKLGYSSATAGLYQLDDIFRFAYEQKFDFVELNYDTVDFLPTAQTIRQVNELQFSTGIAVSVHLPFVDLNLASLIHTIRKASVEQTLKGLDYAEAIGASCAVVHTGRIFLYQPVPLEAAFSALRQSLAELSGTTVPVALENLAVFEDGLIREPEALKLITAEAGFVNCLDFGHAHIEACRPWRQGTDWGEDLIRKYITVLDTDIIHLHLCNNNGQDDLHTATTRGSISFERYADFLSTFPGTVCLEVAGGKPEVERSAGHIRSLAQVPA